MSPTDAEYEKYGAWAVIRYADKNIDRRQCQRIVPFQVINASAPRTGTISLQKALRTLGFASPYHSSALFENCRDCDMWTEALNAKYRPSPRRKPYSRAEFDQLLGHCGAAGDGPAFMFWKELLEAYPDAKVILVDRDREKWLRSMRQVVEALLTPASKVMGVLEPSRAGRILKLTRLYLGYWFGTVDNMTTENTMANAWAAYERHYADVRAGVPKDRLLEYKLGSGWEPLCNFLGVKDIPQIPFPHRNDAQTMGAAIDLFNQLAVKTALRNVAIVVGLVAVLAKGVWELYRRSS
jgi:hypothetical protein